MKKILLLILTIILFTQTGFSQGNSKPWSLEECVEYALKNNITVKRSQLDVEQNNADLSQSRAALFPTLNASGTHRYAFGRTVDPVEYRFVEQTVQSNDFGLSSDVVIFGGFQNQNAIKQNKVLLDANFAALEQAKNDVSINVAGAFLTVLQNKAVLENAILQQNTSAEQVGRTERLVEAGSLPRASYLEIKAQNATDELAVVNAENDVELAKLRLMQFLQLPYDDNFDIEEPNIENIGDLQLTQNASYIYEMALASQPVIRSMELRLRGAEIGERIAKGANFPSLIAFGQANSFYSSRAVNPFTENRIPFSDQIENNFGQSIGLRLNIPIFNNWRVRNELQRATIFKKNTELNTWETQNNLRQEVEQAYLDAKTASKRYNAAQNQVEALQEAFRVTEQRFNLGAANAVDYNVSKNNLNQAETDMIRARYDYIFRMKVLDFYQGNALSLD